MIFELHNGIVAMTSVGEGIPEFANLKKRKSYEKIITYLFFVYGKKSPYGNLFEMDRKKVVSADRLGGDPQEYEKLEALEGVKEAVDKYLMLQYTPKEQLLAGVQRKVAEYLEFWDAMKIDEDNHKVVSESLEGANKLLRLQKELESQVNQEAAESKIVGGGKTNLFEN
tara:strand:+ start:132 stop:638 length:507 start_codon:yes stop_codon:yes gene_type:complete